jgi:creatinine amidohydrolase
MERNSYALDALAWTDVGQLLAHDPRLLLPVGALGQHGPHLPLGTNTFLADAVARRVSEALSILRAPAFAYGVTGEPGGRHAGTSTLRRKTLHRAINELIAGWEDHGVSEIVVITAHRFEPHLDALLMALTSRSTTTVIDLYTVDVSDLLDGDPHLEHGGELETSLMLHLAPERVCSDRIQDSPITNGAGTYFHHRMPTAPAASQGVLGFPSRASAEKGAAVLERWVNSIVAALGRRPG